MNIEELKVRTEHFKIVNAYVEDFIRDEQTIIKHTPVPDDTSLFTILGDFNLLALSTDAGATKFTDMVNSSKKASGFITRLMHLELDLLQILGLEAIATYRKEFHDFYINNSWNRVCSDFPWIWLLPTYQTLIRNS